MFLGWAEGCSARGMKAMAVERKLSMGMVGGGPGAFIGPVHKMAAELDGKIELVAGAFSQSAERSKAAGEGFGIDPARAYADYREMMKAERERADAIDFVVIVTPNHLHLPVAEAALEAGFPVMSDKPATATYHEVLALEAAVAKAGLPYGLTHTYAGYALVREARELKNPAPFACTSAPVAGTSDWTTRESDVAFADPFVAGHRPLDGFGRAFWSAMANLPSVESVAALLTNPTTLAGFPITRRFGGMSARTTLLALTMEPSPTITPLPTWHPQANATSWRIRTGLMSIVVPRFQTRQ